MGTERRARDKQGQMTHGAGAVLMAQRRCELREGGSEGAGWVGERRGQGSGRPRRAGRAKARVVEARASESERGNDREDQLSPARAQRSPTQPPYRARTGPLPAAWLVPAAGDPEGLGGARGGGRRASMGHARTAPAHGGARAPSSVRRRGAARHGPARRGPVASLVLAHSARFAGTRPGSAPPHTPLFTLGPRHEPHHGPRPAPSSRPRARAKH